MNVCKQVITGGIIETIALTCHRHDLSDLTLHILSHRYLTLTTLPYERNQLLLAAYYTNQDTYVLGYNYYYLLISYTPEGTQPSTVLK
jgi:hypothetical protein